MIFNKYILIILSFFLAETAVSQLVINEYCASNENGLTDNYTSGSLPAGEAGDWFEIYNTTGAAVDITGWYVSDKA